MIWKKILVGVGAGVFAIILWILTVLLMGFITANAANAADYAIVSFNDAEHLAALQDSVVDVCDTTWWVIASTIELPNGCIVDSAFVSIVLDDSIIVDSAKIYPYDITCRRLVGVTVIEPLGWHEKWVMSTDTLSNGTRIPFDNPDFEFFGEAIIFYEEVRQ